MIDQSDLLLAGECFRRATRDVGIWPDLIERGQLASLSPFGQMFVYQLKNRGKLGDKKFAINELYKLYYQKDGTGGLRI